MDKYFKKIEELVFKEKYTIRPVHLVNNFNLHIKQAQLLLKSFIENNKNLIVKYGLFGYQGELDDEIRCRRYIEVESEEVEEQKKSFTKLISCTIRSIKDKDNQLNIYPKDENLIKNKEDLINYQKKGFCLNEKVDLREDKLQNLIKRLSVNNGNLNESSNKFANGSTTKEDKLKVENRSKDEEKPKVIEGIKILRTDVKPKNVLSCFKKLETRPSPVKSETFIKKDTVVEVKEVNKKSPKNDIESEREESKLKNGKFEEKRTFYKIKKAFDDESSEDENFKDKIDDIEMDDQIHVKSKISKKIKRSETLDGDSDNDFTSKKQRKTFFDFDDSSENEETSMDKFIETNKLSEKRLLEQESSKLFKEEETYIDEEGYKQHRIIKKVIKEDKSESANGRLVNQENNKELTNNEIKTKKLETNLPLKMEVKKPSFDNKSKPAFDSKFKSSFDNRPKKLFDNKTKPAFDNKSKSASKKQPTIMNFFKPKNNSK